MNINLFNTLLGGITRTDTVNEAGGVAYQLAPKAAIAQLAATGTFANTFYTKAEDQLALLTKLLAEVEPEYAAKLAVYARQRGRMKDTPAVIVAWLFAKGETDLFNKTFPKVIDNGRMLRNFVQATRAGAFGRKSFGTAGRRMVREWIANRRPESVWKDSIGESPSMRDILRMTHPKPRNDAERALFGYLTGKAYDMTLLPEAIREYEAFVAALRAGGEAAESAVVPTGADFRWLTSLPLTEAHWKQIARSMGHQALRMNLNTLARHDVFSDPELTAMLAQRLETGAELGGQLPHQYMSAIAALAESVPAEIRVALGKALDTSLENVKPFGTRPLIFIDVSGSMDYALTGNRGTASSKVKVVDVAALFAAAALKANPSAGVYWFHTEAGRMNLNPRDSVETLTDAIRNLDRGGTDASAPLALALKNKEKAGLVIWLSDEQSWAAPPVNGASATAALWAKYRRSNPGAKAVHINLQPGATVQHPGANDVLNVGGFTDAVWDVIRGFVSGTPDGFVSEVEAIAL